MRAFAFLATVAAVAGVQVASGRLSAPEGNAAAAAPMAAAPMAAAPVAAAPVRVKYETGSEVPVPADPLQGVPNGITWLPDSSMNYNHGWVGKVAGGEYHCQFSNNVSGKKSLEPNYYAFRVDCNKHGGSGATFYFDDGSDTYSLYMWSDGNHFVRWNGNDHVNRIGYKL